jgi:Carboxypeptidase regulatory-like domain
MITRILTTLLWLAVSAALEASPSNTGVVEGNVRVILSKGTSLADDTSPAKDRVPYADCPLVVLSKDGKTEVAQVTLDGEGHFRANLPPGDYVLNAKKHGRTRLRVSARPFTVVAGQTVHVDVEVEMGVPPV